MWLDLGDNLLEDTKIEAQRDERTCSRSQRKFHLFVSLSYLPLDSLPGHPDFSLFGLFREGSIHGAAVSPGVRYVGLCVGTSPCSTLHQHLLELLEIKTQVSLFLHQLQWTFGDH